MDAKTALSASFDDMRTAIDDFVQGARIETAQSLLARLCAVTSTEPLKAFLETTLTAVDIDGWKREHDHGRRHTAIVMPTEPAMRVATQLALCKEFAAQGLDLSGFVFDHYRIGNNSNLALQNFGKQVLQPMLRDMVRLASQRPLPAALLEALRLRPRSTDTVLDGYLEEACRRIKDPAPAESQIAIEKLWDAWERLKQCPIDSDKKQGIGRKIREACPEPKMQELLHVEADLLTKFGNGFRIRHSERDRPAIGSPELVDYWFHRMFAMLTLLLK